MHALGSRAGNRAGYLGDIMKKILAGALLGLRTMVTYVSATNNTAEELVLR